MQHLFGDFFEKESFDDARRLIDEGGKWFRFLNTALDTLNPHVVKTAVMDLGFEAGFYGLRTRDAAKAKYHCNIPWAILFDPTSACNLHCIGCWAAEYGHTLNLSFDVMDKIVREGKVLGCHFYLLTGGEPLMRKKDILRLCRKHPDCEFHAFTNGTLIDDAFCDEVTDVAISAFPSVSKDSVKSMTAAAAKAISTRSCTPWTSCASTASSLGRPSVIPGKTSTPSRLTNSWTCSSRRASGLRGTSIICPSATTPRWTCYRQKNSGPIWYARSAKSAA